MGNVRGPTYRMSQMPHQALANIAMQIISPKRTQRSHSALIQTRQLTNTRKDTHKVQSPSGSTPPTDAVNTVFSADKLPPTGSPPTAKETPTICGQCVNRH